MLWRTLTIVSLAAAAWIVTGGDIRAQSPGGYAPSSPTLSPWLNLYQQNKGPLDSYHSFVRPEMELRATIAQQRAINRTFGADIRELRSDALRPDQSKMHATGSNATFMQYSHYYFQNPSASGGQSSVRAHAWSPTAPTTSMSGVKSMTGMR